MNTLEKVRFVTKDFLQSLKNSDIKSETEELDFKEIFKISDTSSKVEFIKDFLAFANSKGGHIVFGVNKSYEWIGLDDRSDSDVDEANIAKAMGLINRACEARNAGFILTSLGGDYNGNYNRIFNL